MTAGFANIKSQLVTLTRVISVAYIRTEVSMDWVNRKSEIGIGDSGHPFQMFLHKRNRKMAGDNLLCAVLVTYVRLLHITSR